MRPNKTAFITGSAKRIGREIAVFLARGGVNICLHCNTSKDEALTLKDEILKIGVFCNVYNADLLNTQSTILAFQEAKKDFNHIDYLINNASIFEKTSIKTIKEEEFERDFNIHLKSPLFLMQAFAKQNFSMSEGVIINIIDKNIIKKRSNFTAYLLAKKSLLELTYFAAFEFAPLIRVNSISPGFIMEEENILLFKEKSDIEIYTGKKLREIPLNRKGEICDITEALSFLINSSYITGQNIMVDGGSFLY